MMDVSSRMEGFGARLELAPRRAGFPGGAPGRALVNRTRVHRGFGRSASVANA